MVLAHVHPLQGRSSLRLALRPDRLRAQHFAPTWKKFVADHADWEEGGRFHFAQVDCIANGDLCVQEKIAGYPTLWYYRDGKQDQEYKGSRDAESMRVWLEAKLPPSEKEDEERVVDPVVPVALPQEAEQAKEDKEGALPGFKVQQTRQVATVSETGQVIKLDSKGLEELIDPQNGRGPAFAKLCARCQGALRC
jgi:hypothetical protein